MSIRFQFLRDSKGQPIGCIAIQATDKQGRGPSGVCQVEYQYSVLNPEDHFNRTLAREIAASRLDKRPIMCDPLPHHASMHDITEVVMQHIASRPYETNVVGSGGPADRDTHWGVQLAVPSRAKKAAKLWLRTHIK